MNKWLIAALALAVFVSGCTQQPQPCLEEPTESLLTQASAGAFLNGCEQGCFFALNDTATYNTTAYQTRKYQECFDNCQNFTKEMWKSAGIK